MESYSPCSEIIIIIIISIYLCEKCRTNRMNKIFLKFIISKLDCHNFYIDIRHIQNMPKSNSERNFGGLASKLFLGGVVVASSLGLSGCAADIAWGRYQKGEISYGEFKQVRQQEDALFLGGLGGAIAGRSVQQGNLTGVGVGNALAQQGAAMQGRSNVQQNVYVGESQNPVNQERQYAERNQEGLTIPKEEIKHLGGNVDQIYITKTNPGSILMINTLENVMISARTCNEYNGDLNKNNRVDDGDFIGLKRVFSRNEKIRVVIMVNKNLSNLEYRLINKNGELIDSEKAEGDKMSMSINRPYFGGLPVGGYTAILNKGNEFMGKIEFEVTN